MERVKAVNISSITIELDEFSITEMQDKLGAEYTVTGVDEKGHHNYCDIINNTNGLSIAYLEFNNRSVSNIIGNVDSIVTNNNNIISIDELYKYNPKDIKSVVCLNDKLELPIYPYVIDNTCYKCPFNINKNCKYMQIDNSKAKLIKELGIVIKEYPDKTIGVERKYNEI